MKPQSDDEIIEVQLPRSGPGTRLRSWFLTGLVVAGPLAITGYIAWWIVNTVDSWIKPLIPPAYNPDTYLPFPVPGVGLVAALLAITVLGFLTANLVGRSIVSTGERMLGGMPVVRGLYKAVKQIFETIFKQEGTSFRKVGLIEWPGPGLWSICFITEPARGALADALPDEEHLCLFLPAAPPTAGYLVIRPRSKVIEVDMTVEQAFKMVMSMGIIQPEPKVRALLDAARGVQRDTVSVG